ncbi:hypothetical protein D1872_192110 [compost metagenome]
MFGTERKNLQAWQRLNGRLKRFENKVKWVDAFAEKNNLSEKDKRNSAPLIRTPYFLLAYKNIEIMEFV